MKDKFWKQLIFRVWPDFVPDVQEVAVAGTQVQAYQNQKETKLYDEFVPAATVPNPVNSEECRDCDTTIITSMETVSIAALPP